VHFVIAASDIDDEPTNKGTPTDINVSVTFFGRLVTSFDINDAMLSASDGIS
jgi:hypothetical protein